MNATQIQQALIGVEAGCLDKDLSFGTTVWFDSKDDVVSGSHAAKIQEASMVEWLCLRGASLHCIDGSWKVRMPRRLVPTAKQDSPMQYTWTMDFPTRLEALAQACCAMDGEREAKQ